SWRTCRCSIPPCRAARPVTSSTTRRAPRASAPASPPAPTTTTASSPWSPPASASPRSPASPWRTCRLTSRRARSRTPRRTAASCSTSIAPPRICRTSCSSATRSSARRPPPLNECGKPPPSRRRTAASATDVTRAVRVRPRRGQSPQSFPTRTAHSLRVVGGRCSRVVGRRRLDVRLRRGLRIVVLSTRGDVGPDSGRLVSLDGLGVRLGRSGLLGLLHRRLLGRVRLEHELDDGHRRVVPLAGADLRDAGVAARTLRDRGCDRREQLVDDPLVGDRAQHATTRGQVALLRERDQTLRDRAQALGLVHGGGDGLVLEELRSHVVEHDAL